MFDTLGKTDCAHRAGGPTPYKVPARGTGKRPPSYMRRQIRRRENFLQRNSGFPPAKEETEGDDKTSHMQEEGDLLDKKVPSPGQTTGDEIDNNISLDLTPHMAKGLLENSNISEKDTDESNSDTEGGSIVSTEDPMHYVSIHTIRAFKSF